MTTQPPTKDESSPNVIADPRGSARRGQKGFTKGISGNPQGRPRGSTNKIQSFSQGLIDDHAEVIIAKALEMALDYGDIRALKLLSTAE